MRPKRVQRKRTKGWKKPEDAIDVTRPSIFGNPYKVGDLVALNRSNKSGERGYAAITVTEENCLLFFRIWAQYLIRTSPSRIREVLRDHDLMCWCPPEKACHADIWLDLVND